MGAREEHLAQARANRAHAERLLELYAAQPDNVLLQWAVTAAFYAAVHFIESELANRHLHSELHADRAAYMRQVGVPRDVRNAYYSLKDASEDARYRLGKFNSYWVRQSVLDTDLARVERFAQRAAPPKEEDGPTPAR